jgi:hypothetical protein
MNISIAKRPASAEPWSIPMSALLGFMTGIFLATIRHFSHDHPGYTPAARVEHFFPHMIAAATACALLFALVATIRNWLKRVVVR